MAKRAIDVSVAGSALVVLAPAFAGLTALVWRRHGWPPVFVQERPGYAGRVFRLVKFRTMTDARAPDGTLLPDAERLTPFGRALRASSLDELPELLNVLRGEMSLVGPRPLLVRYLERYSAEQARRHDLPPGITGWSAVNGRNALDWDDKLALDVWYVDHWSLALDMKILWKTARTVLLREGIAADGEATMPEFMGSARRAVPVPNGAAT
ncbi:MAG: sugar transferase [Myxococcota bacterium]